MKIKNIWDNYHKKKNRKDEKVLVEYYYPYTVKYIQKSSKIFEDILHYDEILSEAGYELLKVIKEWDPEKSPKFLPFLYKRIKWKIIYLLRQKDKLSWYERRLIKKYESIKQSFFGPSNPKPPSDEQICEKLGITVEQLDNIKFKDQFPDISLNSMKPIQVDNLMASMAISMHIPTPAKLVERRDLIEKILGMLSDRYRQVFIMRYFNECSMAEIAEVMGMTTSGVLSVLKRQRQKIRNVLVPQEELGEMLNEYELNKLFAPKEKQIKRLLKKAKTKRKKKK